MIERVCIACHPFENIIKTRRTVREWNDQIPPRRAVVRPAPIPTSRRSELPGALHGLVRVNTATAEELTAVLA